MTQRLRLYGRQPILGVALDRRIHRDRRGDDGAGIGDRVVSRGHCRVGQCHEARCVRLGDDVARADIAVEKHVQRQFLFEVEHEVTGVGDFVVREVRLLIDMLPSLAVHFFMQCSQTPARAWQRR